jgi:CubicO group peptidase (beta-lactamase class C family)
LHWNRLFAATVAGSFLFLAQVAQAAPQADEVAQVVRAEMEKQHILGLALLVSRNGVPVRLEGFGLANVELDVPVTPKTIFQSGSIGKQFTATAVMLLVQEGKIDLNDPLSKYFPDGPDWWKDVTIRELLSHTAGFTDYPKDFDLRKDYTEDELIKMIEAIPPAYSPGTSWSYSNLDYVTLGVLIHKVSGQYFGDFLQGRVFKPLGMSTTRIMSEADIIPNRAAGYRLDKGQLKNQEWASPSANSTADGSLYFTIFDLTKWDAALYRQGIERIQQTGDVDGSEVARRQAQSGWLRFRVVSRIAKWSSRDGAQWAMAAVLDADFAILRR